MHCGDKQNGDPLIEKVLYNATSGHKLHRVLLTDRSQVATVVHSKGLQGSTHHVIRADGESVWIHSGMRHIDTHT